MIIALIVLTIILFSISLVILGKSQQEYSKYKKDIDNINDIIDSSIKLNRELYTLYTIIEGNQKLHVQAMELITKHQRASVADIAEFREQVSNALIAVVEELGSSKLDLVKMKTSKDKMN